MRLAWISLAHLLVACSGSHGRTPPAPGTTGTDAGGTDAAEIRRDAGGSWAADAGTTGPAACAPQDAHQMLCPAVACDGPPTWYWNGDACAPVECGTCEGTECASGFGSLDLCTSAHAGCDASLCRATGGTWKWWVEQCGHDICGAIPFADCEVGMPACNCGAYGTFQPGTGCVTDPSCPTPEPGTPEELCRWTGGTWGPFCCHSECGERCPDACVAPACDCGPRRVFDEGSGGCIEHARCWERRLGQRCDDTTRCEPGTLCCDYCGGPGCLGTPTCRPVVCGEPHLDMCGNCVDCP